MKRKHALWGALALLLLIAIFGSLRAALCPVLSAVVAVSRTHATRTLALLLAVPAVILQALLGFLSVHTRLAVVPVSLHTLVAAILLVLVTSILTLTWAPQMATEGVDGARESPSPPGWGHTASAATDSDSVGSSGRG